MKKILAFLFTFLLLFTIMACDEEEQVISHSISFSTNGGSEVAEMIIEGNQTSVSVPTPVKEGYEFLGWYTDMRMSKPWDGSVSSDLVLYAKWKTIQYVLSFETNGGEEIESLNLKFKDNIGRLPTPKKEGHTFGGWFLDSGLSEKYSSTDMPSMPSHDVVLYAKWTINTYLVQFIKDDYLVESISLEYNKLVTEITDSEVTSKKGHTFLGWYSNGVKFDFSSPIKSDLDLVAKYERNKYKVNFNIDGNIISKEFLYGTNIELIASPTKEGYTFAGWEYSDTIPTVMPDYDITLVATWTVNSHDLILNYNSNDGKVTEIINYGTTLNIPNNPSKLGYEFDGWYSDSGNKLTADIIGYDTPIEITGYIARFTKTLKKYVVTTVATKGSITGVESGSSYEYGTTLALTAVPNKGHEFLYWMIIYPDGSHESFYDKSIEVAVTDNIEILAAFRKFRPRITSTQLLYSNKQISADNKVPVGEYFRIVVGVESYD